MSQLTLRVTGAEQSTLGSNAEMHFDANGGTIGRAQSNNWALPDPACYMSSQHALISFQNDKFYITDLSSNGTYINGQETPIGKNNTVCFDEVNSLAMGPYSIEVQIQNVAANNSQNGSLTAMFAPEQFDSPAPSAVPLQDSHDPIAPAEPFGEAEDPLALLGGSPDPAPDFPADWASDDTPSVQSSFDQQDMNPSNRVHDAFVPPQATPGTSPNAMPELPPENWDDTFFAAAPIPDIKKPEAPTPETTFDKPAPASSTPAPGSDLSGIPDDPDFFGSAEPQVEHLAAPVAEPTEALDDATLVGMDTHSPFASPEPQGLGQAPQAPRPDPTPAAEPLSQSFTPEPATPLATPEPIQAAPEPIQTSPDPVQAAPFSTGAPQAATTNTPNEMKVAEATFRANGLDTELLKDAEFVDQAVALLPYFLEGTLNILQSRAQVKNELRASKTVFQAIDNNPLKYSVNTQDAVQNLFTHRRPGFLSPNDAVKEAFIDIGKHETALVAGIQGGLNGLLDKIKPETIEKRIEANESKKNLFGKISSSKKWDFFKETYSHITDNSGDSFLELFGNDFLSAYETHINQKDKNGK